MAYADVATNENGFLVNAEEWSEDLAAEIAVEEKIAELTQRHWDLINYLRGEYFDNNASQPNERAMVKAMSAEWGEKISTKDLYTLFPMQPSKQAARIAGLPETKRKGGY